MSLPRWPRIVAEALRDVSSPAAPRQLVHPAAAAETGRVIAAHLAAPRFHGPVPAFLLAHQVDSWRRTVAALREHGAALLVEGVGRGKTYIALGAAAEERASTVIAPAILEPQWRAAARRTGARIHFHSHERLSRSQRPPDSPVVIIDEAHRFRTAATFRAITVAPWLVGRRTILCTATPIVNRTADLLALLDLVVADDVLALHGVASLAGLADAHIPPRCLDRLVIRSANAGTSWPRDDRPLTPSPMEEMRAARGIDALARLRLSTNAGIARLVRTMLLDALASSDAAFVAGLRRYGALLAHAGESGGASRKLLRRYAGVDLDQTVLWSLLEPCPDDGDLAGEDATVVHDIVTTLHPADQGWISELRTLQLDGLPTICFTRHRATAMALRHGMDGPVAWVTGSAAGVGAVRLGRDQVLAAFGPSRPAWRLLSRTPTLLIATDVAAEGLDLQGAGRIVHIDTPWTAMRIAQREGRLTRIGQAHDSVSVVHRLPARAIETAIAPRARVTRKATTSERWLHAIERNPAEPAVSATQRTPVCVVRTRGATLAVFLVSVERGLDLGVRVLLSRHAAWEDGADLLETLLSRARAAPEGTMATSAYEALVLDALAAISRADACVPAMSPALVARLHLDAARARRTRDAHRLEALDRTLRFVSRCQGRGGRAMIADLEHGLLDPTSLAIVPDQPALAPPRLSVIAAVVFRSGDGPLR